METELQILCVEDSFDYYTVLERHLALDAPRPFKIIRSLSLAEGVRFLESNGCDLVLLDLKLPDSQGLDTVKKIREASGTVPVIVMTADQDKGQALEALREGAHDYLYKLQIDGPGLWRSIQYALERTKLENELHDAITLLEQSNQRLRSTQLQLIEVEKMESIGRMAAGVAHEVKNPLATLVMGVQYLKNNMVPDNEAMQFVIKEMEEAIQRADEIVKGLVQFSAPLNLEIRDEDINAIIRQALLLLRHDLTKTHVEAIPSYGEALPLLPLDRNKILQALLNLCTNAIHAMPRGGYLSVTTGCQPLTHPGVEAGERVEGNYLVTLRIEDTGTGIPEDRLEKIFDPFYTTKAAGRGTGLGLAITKSIIDLHGGGLEISNRADGGVAVKITFIS